MIDSAYSKIIAGTMRWGIWGTNFSKAQMIDMMVCCLENKITTFDHADIYGDYTTEAAFGSAFRESKIKRDQIQLISKCGIQKPSENRMNDVKHYDFSANYIIHSVEQSLRHLQTDYLDLLLLHRPSPLMQPEEIASAIEKLKIEGKIMDFGVSNFNPSQTILIENHLKIQYNQIEFSLTHFEAMVNGSLDHMQVHNIVPMAWSPMGSVFKGDDERASRIKQQLAVCSTKYEVTEDVLLLAWILKHPARIHPVCGTTNQLRMVNITKASTLELDQMDWFALWAASLGKPVP